MNLVLSHTSIRKGSDNLGSFEETVLFYKPKVAENISQEFEARFRIYDGDRPFILFGQVMVTILC